MPRLAKTTAGGQPRVIDLAARHDSRTRSDLRSIVCVGDSMVAGNQDGPGHNWPAILRAALGPGVTVVNHGNPAWTSTELAIYQGGRDVTVGAFTIPAAITPAAVTVTGPSGSFSPPSNDGIFYRWVGTLAGVPGVMRRQAGSGTWTFTRAVAGADNPVSAGAVFHSSAGDPYPTSSAILMLGRNNFATRDVVAADTAAIIAALSPQIKRVLVCSIFTAVAETAGTAAYQQVVAANSRLAEIYGPAYVDARRWVIDNGLAFNGLTPTSDDTTAVAADTIPPQLCMPAPDGLHLNRYGVRAVAKVLLDKLVSLGRNPDPVGSVPSVAVNGGGSRYWNPGFEDAAGVNLYALFAEALHFRTTDAARTGMWGWRSNFHTARDNPDWLFDCPGDMATPKSWSVWVRPSKTATVRLVLAGYGQSGYVASDDTGVATSCPAGQWTKLSLSSAVTAANVDTLYCYAAATGTWSPGDRVDFDDLAVVAGTTAP